MVKEQTAQLFKSLTINGKMASKKLFLVFVVCCM